jgi:hypothetical protein
VASPPRPVPKTSAHAARPTLAQCVLYRVARTDRHDAQAHSQKVCHVPLSTPQPGALTCCHSDTWCNTSRTRPPAGNGQQHLHIALSSKGTVPSPRMNPGPVNLRTRGLRPPVVSICPTSGSLVDVRICQLPSNLMYLSTPEGVTARRQAPHAALVGVCIISQHPLQRHHRQHVARVRPPSRLQTAHLRQCPSSGLSRGIQR